MKIMHIGDLHLGRSLREYSLIDDQEYILDQILDLIAANGIQVLLIFLGRRYLEFSHTRGKGVQGEISFSAFSFCTSFSTALSWRGKSKKGKKVKGEKVKR